MTQKHFERVFIQAVDELRKLAPKDTGNLAYNAIKYRWKSNNTFEIYVDAGEVGVVDRKDGIAPYMPFTNEPWFGGRINPNEGWWNNAIEFIIYFIARKFKGELK